MKVHLEQEDPAAIERRSMQIIAEELAQRGVSIPPEKEPVVMRCIHASADLDYATSLAFSDGAVATGIAALLQGALIVTDTQMAKAGINRTALAKTGSEVACFMSDDDVASEARRKTTTRAVASMEKAARLATSHTRPTVFAIGNAPTALIRLYEMIEDGQIHPDLVIGVPVGFVNVVESKELIMTTDVPFIVARGRKGGSSIAAAICNALLYEATGRKLQDSGPR